MNTDRRGFPSFYQSVIEAVPAAKVPGLVYQFATDNMRFDGELIGDDLARALCLQHWLTLLPQYALLWRVPNMNNGELAKGDSWRVGERRSVVWMDEPVGPTPEEAIGNYLKAKG